MGPWTSLLAPPIRPRVLAAASPASENTQVRKGWYLKIRFWSSTPDTAVPQVCVGALETAFLANGLLNLTPRVSGIPGNGQTSLTESLYKEEREVKIESPSVHLRKLELLLLSVVNLDLGHLCVSLSGIQQTLEVTLFVRLC